jgi:flavin-dependent dehydrogenase
VTELDAVIVGARCAGATLATRLARGGWNVLMIDRDELGSDTLSTHCMFPDALARLDRLGVLGELCWRHELHPSRFRMRLLGRETAGCFTAVGGFTRALCVRRPVLDRALGDMALAAGVQARFGERVTGLIGSGRDGDPVTGLVLGSGERITAPWVIGADGRASFVARTLGLPREDVLTGDISFMLSYWRGLPETDTLHMDIGADAGLNWFRCEDDVGLLISIGPADHSHGDAATRERKHLDVLRSFPETLDPRALDGATRISEIRVAPETMLRGFFKQASGPGWALVGDAGHFKHPGTAQGIGDALAQAVYVGDALLGADPQLEDYAAWRAARANGHYEWSFAFGRLPVEAQTGPIADGLARDPQAAQDYRDTLARSVHPTEALNGERLAEWFAAPVAGRA